MLQTDDLIKLKTLRELKTLAAVRLSWLLQHPMAVGDSVPGLTERGGGPSIENGDRVPTLGAHSPGKLPSMILERRI